MLIDTTPVTTVHPAQHRETLQSRCEYYRQCGFDALVRPDVRRIFLLATSRIGAVILPSELAPQVRTKLRERGLSLGPTVSHPRSGRWTVIVRPDIDDDAATFARLFRSYISVVRSGGEIALPTPHGVSSSVDRHWISSPTDLVSSGAALVHAITECVGSLPRWRS